MVIGTIRIILSHSKRHFGVTMPTNSGEFAMRFMVLVKANQDTEAGVMPSEQLLTENKSKQTK